MEFALSENNKRIIACYSITSSETHLLMDPDPPQVGQSFQKISQPTRQ